MMQDKKIENLENNILNFINAIRGLDEQGIAVVSGVIAAELKACRTDRKKVLSIVK